MLVREFSEQILACVRQVRMFSFWQWVPDTSFFRRQDSIICFDSQILMFDASMAGLQLSWWCCSIIRPWARTTSPWSVICGFVFTCMYVCMYVCIYVYAYAIPWLGIEWLDHKWSANDEPWTCTCTCMCMLRMICCMNPRERGYTCWCTSAWNVYRYMACAYVIMLSVYWYTHTTHTYTLLRCTALLSASQPRSYACNPTSCGLETGNKSHTVNPRTRQHRATDHVQMCTNVRMYKHAWWPKIEQLLANLTQKLILAKRMTCLARCFLFCAFLAPTVLRALRSSLLIPVCALLSRFLSLSLSLSLCACETGALYLEVLNVKNCALISQFFQ